MKSFTMDPLTNLFVKGSNEIRGCCTWRSKFLFALLALGFFILPLNDIYAQKNTAENIQGIAPVITPPGGFEIDGNASAESAGDWESDAPNEAAGLFLSTLTPEDFDNGVPANIFDPQYQGGVYSFFYRDDISNNDPTIFTSSNKIDDDPETYTWGPGSSPNKNEIQTAVVHFTYGDPDHPSADSGDPENPYTTSDDLWVIFAADRQVTNGSSYIDFEFLQKSLIRTGIESGSGGFQSDGTDGGRTLGDLLVTVEFTIGGAAAKVVVRRWVFEGGEYFYKEFTDYGTNTIFGTVNTEVTSVPWSVYFTDPEPDGSYLYEINQWAEGAVNLSYYFGNDDPCLTLSTLFVRTRTSGSSGTSELKDFPQLEQLSIDLNQEITVTDPDPVCSPATVDLTAEGVATGCTGTLSYWNDADATDEVNNPSAVGDGTYYIKCTSDQNDQCFDIKAVNVTVDTTPDITVTDPDAVCSPETVDITGAASGCGEGFSLTYWEDAEASVSLETPSAIAVSGTYYIKCTNDENENCYEIEPVVVVISDTPDITVTDPDAVCSPSTVDITGAASGCGEGFTLSYWQDAEATMSLDSPSAVAASGTYYIKCTNDSNSECYEIEPVVITIDQTPDITVTDPGAVCDPDTVDITSAASGCGEGFTLSYWQDAEATVSLGTPSAVAVSGTYYIKCTNDNNANCYEIEPVEVVISDSPDITITDPDPVCSPETADITGAASGCGEGYSLTYWQDEDATVVLNDPDAVGEGTYYIKCTNDSNADCFDVKAVNVIVDDTPSISIVNPDPVCDPGTVDLTADGIVLNCSGNLSYWTDADAINNPVPDPTAVGGGTYYVKCTNPDNDNCFDIKMVSVTANDLPDITVTDPDPACSPDTVDITQAASGCGEDATLSYWEDAAATISLSNPSAVAVSGTYYIKCTNNENENCYDIEPVNVTISDTPDITVTDPDPVCSPETVDLTGVFSGCGEGYTVSFWNDAEATSSLMNPDAVGVSGTYYIKCVNNENTDCYDIEAVVVTIEICDQDACTLGYWKNHTDRWECYSTCTLYSEVFGIDFSVYSGNPDDADLTLLEALNLGGGGIYNLARQSVAALLNECHGDVSYPYTGDLIQDVYDAFIGGFAGQLASELDMINNSYECPLGGSRATSAPSESCPSAAEAFSVSPVPFKDNLNIKFENNMSNINVQIFDIRGNMVKSQALQSAAAGHIMTLSAEFVRGNQMYLIKVSSDQGSFTKNVVSGK